MKNLLCVDVFEGIDYDRLFYMAKEIGFDGLFSGEVHGDDFESMKRVRRIANETGLLYEFSHSKIPGCMELWRNSGGGEDYVKLLKRNIDNCARLEIPILVVHCQPEYQTEPDMALGLSYLEPVVRYAEDAGVKIAFENIDHPQCLLQTMAHFPNSHVGFCYDAGHEACRGYGYEFLPLVGDRLICTHIHDNEGVFNEDKHMLPFDGTLDFERVARQIRESGYKGTLMLEVLAGASDHYEGVSYQGVSPQEYLRRAADAAKRLANMV